MKGIKWVIFASVLMCLVLPMVMAQTFSASTTSASSTGTTLTTNSGTYASSGYVTTNTTKSSPTRSTSISRKRFERGPVILYAYTLNGSNKSNMTPPVPPKKRTLNRTLPPIPPRNRTYNITSPIPRRNMTPPCDPNIGCNYTMNMTPPIPPRNMTPNRTMNITPNMTANVSCSNATHSRYVAVMLPNGSYASSSGLSIPPSKIVTPSTSLCGDINGDGRVTIFDSLILGQIIRGNKFLAPGFCYDCLDVDGNGIVSSADTRRIALIVVGLSSGNCPASCR